MAYWIINPIHLKCWIIQEQNTTMLIGDTMIAKIEQTDHIDNIVSKMCITQY